MNLNARRRRAAEAARNAGVGALLVTHLPDVQWLSGFTGSNAALVLSAAKGGPVRPVLFTDGRYTAQARAEATGARVVIAPKAAALAACEWLAEHKIRSCGFDDGNTTVAALKQMRTAVPATLRKGLFQPVGALVSTLRWVKDTGEIAKMRRAAALGCRLFEELLGTMEPG
ncbi:MAG TPA: aminopeptidase P family N-terminal domain-containing protein, partial [Acidobacteriaceae bacterium]|nr:aminopeptidase P family N-terminal domain-containing protein [Acidobacteriaceae bacterium]